MITVIAEIRVRPGHRDNVLQAIAQLIPTVLAEEGCESYGPLIDENTALPWQHKTPSSIFMLETWQSVACLEQHLQMPHMAAFQEQVKSDVLEMRIQILKAAE